MKIIGLIGLVFLVTSNAEAKSLRCGNRFTRFQLAVSNDLTKATLKEYGDEIEFGDLRCHRKVPFTGLVCRSSNVADAGYSVDIRPSHYTLGLYVAGIGAVTIVGTKHIESVYCR